MYLAPHPKRSAEMISHYQIREARSQDADAIACLYRQLVDDASVKVLPEVLADLSLSSLGFLLVAEDGDQILGTALLAICQDAMYGEQPFAVIENIVVDSLYLRSGIGSLLIEEVERICCLRDCSKILLSSSCDRVQAHQFFQRHGYSDRVKIGFVKYRSQLANFAEPE